MVPLFHVCQTTERATLGQGAARRAPSSLGCRGSRVSTSRRGEEASKPAAQAKGTTAG
jgi:hypothetical protein